MVRNFLFHRVSPVRDELWDPMDVKLFEKCISYISKNYSVKLIEDLEPGNLYSNTATICFDDGYKDNIEYALPILEKYGVKASFYIVTDCIEKNIPTWTYILEYLFKQTEKQEFGLQFSFIPKELQTARLDAHNNRIDYVRKLKITLKKLDHNQREEVLGYIKETLNDVNFPRIMLNWEDIKTLLSLGHNIGSHTVTHPMLGTMDNNESMFNELASSRNKIYECAGVWVKTISYPVGSYNNKVIELSKKAGYTMGLAVKQKPYNTKEHSVFEIPRIELYNESWFKTRLRMNGTLEKIKTGIGYK